MLPTNLTTNEVKDSSGTEVEFLRMSTEGRKVIFQKSGELPNAPSRLTVSHGEVGDGLTKRRRSLVRVDRTINGGSGTPRVVTAYVVCDFPVGDLASDAELKTALAYLLSFCASTGADTTVKYDCTGNGASALIAGSL